MHIRGCERRVNLTGDEVNHWVCIGGTLHTIFSVSKNQLMRMEKSKVIVAIHRNAFVFTWLAVN